MYISCHVIYSTFRVVVEMQPPCQPSHIPARRTTFALTNKAEEKGVEGNTFHAYSIPKINASLLRKMNSVKS